MKNRSAGRSLTSSFSLGRSESEASYCGAIPSNSSEPTACSTTWWSKSESRTDSGPASRNEQGPITSNDPHALIDMIERVPRLSRTELVINLMRIYAIHLVHRIVTRQPAAVQLAFSFGQREPSESHWGGPGKLYVTLAAPAAEWQAIGNRVLDLRLELEGHKSVIDCIEVVPFREPATAGHIDRDGYLAERVGESWTVRLSSFPGADDWRV